jgi:two-component SAPR family response regulator
MTRRILIVEDEPIVALNYAAILQEAGYESVGPVGSIKQGLDLVASEQLDGAVLDIDISGAPVDPIIVALRAKRVPYIFVSAYPERAGRYGNAIFVEKPCTAAQLFAAVKRLMPRPEAIAAARPADAQ